jgi:hypothetical protein
MRARQLQLRDVSMQLTTDWTACSTPSLGTIFKPNKYPHLCGHQHEVLQWSRSVVSGSCTPFGYTTDHTSSQIHIRDSSKGS